MVWGVGEGEEELTLEESKPTLEEGVVLVGLGEEEGEGRGARVKEERGPVALGGDESQEGVGVGGEGTEGEDGDDPDESKW